MGLAGLTAVFGMGTGGAPPVWSPERRPPGGRAEGVARFAVGGHARAGSHRSRGRVVLCTSVVAWHFRSVGYPPRRGGPGAGVRTLTGGPSRRLDLFGKRPPGCPAAALVLVCGRAGRGGQAIGCWNWSAATLARRALPAHRPGRLPGAFIACAKGNLVLEGASRLDAFSAYPVPTWLPGDALDRTAGTPEVGPPQSSRTRGDAPQVSYAHGR